VARKTKEPYGIRLLPSVRAAAEKAANNDSRTFSGLLEKLLTDHLKANGYLPDGKIANKRK
jgi:hypothetical protein